MTSPYVSAPRPLPYRVLAGVIGSLLLAFLRPLVSHAQTVPPTLPMGSALPPAITVLVRTQAGARAMGVVLLLRPAPPDLGGPLAGARAIQATTNAQGEADFPPLDGAIWYLTLHGTVAGRPIEDPAGQGKPPWGTNPTGGGFPILADPSLESAAAIPTPVADNAPVLVPILLVDRQDVWLAGLDLGSETGPPISLPGAGQPTPAPVLPPSPTVPLTGSSAATTGPGSGIDPAWTALAGLPVLAGLVLAGGLAIYRRRHPHRPVPAAYLRSAPPARATRKETHPHA